MTAMTDSPDSRPAAATAASAGPAATGPDAVVPPSVSVVPPSVVSSAAGEATPPDPAARGASRAGRDLKSATGVGIGLALVVLVSLVFFTPSFLVVIVGAVGLGAWEMRRAMATAGLLVPAPPLLLGTASMAVSAYVQGGEGLLVSFGLTVVALLVWRVADGAAGAARDLGASILATLYPGLLAGFAVLMLTPDDGASRIVFFLLVTVFSDIGGYAVGVLAGRHPMAPSVSPKKSWEGFAGSVAASAAVGAIALVLLLDGPWWAGALIGALAAAAATLGDLIESTIKRDLGVKDMGDILPGHGGLMDRLDSLVIVAPLIWAMLRIVVPLP
jgi:phosphatidate cytidylyltransferase